MSSFFQYGEKVAGYDVLVLNEREARADSLIVSISIGDILKSISS